jgi:hypothetical protein
VTSPLAPGMLGAVDNQPERRETRREEIGERLAEIRARIDDLQQAQRESRHPVVSGEQLAEALHHVAFSRATAHWALASSIEAFLRAARAHDRSAVQHERAAAAGGNADEHRQRAAHHRAAAAEDRQRAEAARLLLASRADNGQEDEQPGDSTASLAPPAGPQAQGSPPWKCKGSHCQCLADGEQVNPREKGKRSRRFRRRRAPGRQAPCPLGAR